LRGQGAVTIAGPANRSSHNRPLREKTNGRLEILVEMGVDDARISGADEEGYGMGAFFLLLNDPDIYGLPPDADVVTRKFESLWVPAVAEAMVLCIAA
jgi:formate dehydrogenase iron-sulfur subunit